MSTTGLILRNINGSIVPICRRQEVDTFLDLRSQMNRLFDNFFELSFRLSPFFGETSLMGDFSHGLNIRETKKEITVSGELPGMEPADINIALDRGALTISGEKRAETEEKGKRFFQVEPSYGSFHRSIALPNEVDDNKIDVTFKRGILKVKLHKTKATQEKSKRISNKTG